MDVVEEQLDLLVLTDVIIEGAQLKRSTGEVIRYVKFKVAATVSFFTKHLITCLRIFGLRLRSSSFYCTSQPFTLLFLGFFWSVGWVLRKGKKVYCDFQGTMLQPGD